MAHVTNKKTKLDPSPSAVFGTLGVLLAAIGLLIASIFTDKPLSSIFIVVALALLIVFFVLAYKMGKSVDDAELAEAKEAHPSNSHKTQKSTFSVMEPPTDPILNQLYADGSIWNVVTKDGQRILKRSVLTDGKWVETQFSHETVSTLDTSAIGPVEEATAKYINSSYEAPDEAKKD